MFAGAVFLLLAGRDGSSFLKTVRPAKLLAEAFHAAGRIDELLLAGEEWVATRANIDVDLGHRAAGGEGVSAGTVDGTGMIAGVDFGFHVITNSLAGRALPQPRQRQPVI